MIFTAPFDIFSEFFILCIVSYEKLRTLEILYGDCSILNIAFAINKIIIKFLSIVKC